MRVFRDLNVVTVGRTAIPAILRDGQKRPSRNGPVYSLPEDVASVYERPLERVVLDPERDCNPYLHLLESAWMLAGREDLEFLRQIVPRFAEYSDDEETLRGAYGRRWRVHWDVDQLREAGRLLAGDPWTRRVAVSVWDPSEDLGARSADVPCNVSAVLTPRGGKVLDLTVLCRSNDAIWGAYGANAVHWSYLLEYVAARAGLRVGTYTQVSCDLHVYEEQLEPWVRHPQWKNHYDRYEAGDDESTISPQCLIAPDEDPDDFDRELQECLRTAGAWPVESKTRWVSGVLRPALRSHREFLCGSGVLRFERAAYFAEQCTAPDWRAAMLSWIERRRSRFLETGRGGRSKTGILVEVTRILPGELELRIPAWREDKTAAVRPGTADFPAAWPVDIKFEGARALARPLRLDPNRQPLFEFIKEETT